MNLLPLFSALAWVCVASGCTSSTNVADPEPVQPTGFTFESTAGSFASFGWTGTLHDVEEPLDTPFGVKTTECTGGADGVCRFEGPTDPGNKINRRRCLFQMSKTCNTDRDCPLASDQPTPCVYIYDAPISTPLPSARNSNGQVPIGACAWSYIPIAAPGQPPTITGTLNLASGDLNLENLKILLQLNSSLNGFHGACAECVGDPTPNDGVKGGTCKRTTHLGTANGIADDGPDIGMPCDTNRYGTFPGFEGSYSMDCSPTVDPGGRPTEFGGSFTSLGFQVSITDQSPLLSDASFMGERGFCGMCPDGVTVCASNADCGGQTCGQLPPDCDPNPFPLDDNLNLNPNFNSSFSSGQCRNPQYPMKFAVSGNSCVDKQCNWNRDAGLGTCTSKLTGTTVGCYPPDNIIAPGLARADHHLSTIYYANTANARCIAAGMSAQVNGQLGLPGLMFQKRNFKIIPEYAEDQQ
jgi:hypothetical protein